MIMKKCEEHGYTLEDKCKKCGEETASVHYKFVKIKDVSEIHRKK